MKFELKQLPRNCSNEEIIAEIQRVDAIVAKEILTRSDFLKHSKISPTTVQKRFGGWEEALIAASLGHKYSYSGKIISEKARSQKARTLTDTEIIAEIQRVDAIVVLQ